MPLYYFLGESGGALDYRYSNGADVNQVFNIFDLEVDVEMSRRISSFDSSTTFDGFCFREKYSFLIIRNNPTSIGYFRTFNFTYQGYESQMDLECYSYYTNGDEQMISGYDFTSQKLFIIDIWMVSQTLSSVFKFLSVTYNPVTEIF